MCGLAGFLRPGGLVAGDAELAERLADTLVHRGPDDSGTWLDKAAGVALAHRRLAVIDLSPAGHQPMLSASGRFVLAFNGEIYNHVDMRADLHRAVPTIHWRGHSDTETLLAGIERWGLDECLQKVVGMFAFALWDREDRTLVLARDRIGEKPMYYGWQGDTFLFGSELKALRAHPAFRAELDTGAIAGYLRRGYVACPMSVYTGIHKLTPGSYLVVPLASRDRDPQIKSYWSLGDVIEKARANPFQGDYGECCDELERHLTQSVAAQSIADVPLGAFLSGGIDSTAVVAMMQSQSTIPVRTFTIGFFEDGFSEAPHAKRIAEQLGTDHTEFQVTPDDALDVIPRLSELFDEPFGDSSAVPTFLVSRLAREHVTVSLSGDGGDELFGGYTRYQRTNKVWKLSKWVPSAVGRLLGSLPMADGVSVTGKRTMRLARYLSASTGEQCYAAQLQQCFGGAADLAEDPLTVPQPPGLTKASLIERMMYIDSVTYLPDDILVKVDRASMAVSLETRVPMLDHRLVEFAWRVPLRFKVQREEGKWLLKRLVERHVPSALVSRPKMGFGLPLAQWLRGSLRDWAEDLLSEHRLNQHGVLDAEFVRQRWSSFVKGSGSDTDDLWLLLALQGWLASSSVR